MDVYFTTINNGFPLIHRLFICILLQFIESLLAVKKTSNRRPPSFFFYTV